MWTSEDALALQVPVLGIDVAVAMREMSVLKEERETASRICRAAAGVSRRPAIHAGPTPQRLVRRDGHHLCPGMAQLRRASEVYGYLLKLEERRPHLAGRLHYSARRFWKRYAPPTTSAQICPTC